MGVIPYTTAEVFKLAKTTRPGQSVMKRSDNSFESNSKAGTVTVTNYTKVPSKG